MFVKRETPSPGGSDRSREGVHCDLCGSSNPAVRCDKCNGHAFCLSCDDMYHRHPKRKQHLRKAIDSYNAAVPGSNIRPPSGQRANVPGDPSKMPIPPPRKKKGKPFFPGFGAEIPALPKKEFSITEKLGSIRRFMSNRPLPPIPKNELPLQQGAIPPKPRAASPKTSNEQQQVLNNRTRTPRPQENRSGSPEYQNILAHLTKVAQNSADEWEEEPSVSTSGSTRGSSVGDDIGWGQDVAPLAKSGAPPPLRNKAEDMTNPGMEDWQGFGTMRRNQMQRGFAPPDGMQGRMGHSTSMGNLQSGYPNPQLQSPGLFPAPYPNYFPQGGVPGSAYPGVYPGFVGQFPRGSWSHLAQKGGEEDDDLEGGEEDEELANQGYNGGTLTKSSKSQMKRSQSVMYDPILAAQQGGFFPFGALPHGYPGSGYFPPGYPPYWSPHPGQRLSTPSSPVPSTRTLNRKTRGRSRKHQRDDESMSSDRSRGDSSRRGSRSNRVRSESSGPDPSSEEEHEEEGTKTRDNRTHSRSSDASKDERSQSRGSDSVKNDALKDNKEEEFVVPEIEDKPPAPPPPIPTDQWECTFCTFINPPGGRVCGVCCKTISWAKDAEKESGDSKGTTSPSSKSGSKDELTELKEKKKKAKEEFLNFSPEFLKEQEQLEEEIRKRLERNRKLSEGFPGEPISRRSSLTEATVKPPEEETSSQPINASTSPTYSPQRELSPTLSSPHQSKSVTVAASPSPAVQPASPVPIIDKVNSVTSSDNNVASHSSQASSSDKNVKVQPSMKTDSSCQTNVEEEAQPQPQLLGHSISVGTDNISEISQDDSLNSPAAKVEMGTSPPRLTKDMSQNLFDRTGHYSNLERSVSQSELRDDLMFPGRQFANERKEDFHRGQLLRSLSRASLVSEPGMYGLQDQIIRAPDSPFMQRKGLGTDWRKQRRPSDLSSRDYIPQPQLQGGWYQRDSRNNYPSMEDMLERRRQETMRAQGLEMIRLIRKAELCGFLPDDLQVALNHCSADQDPIDWLEENWTNMIETVVTLATNYGHDKPDNDVGIISAGEAKEALRIHRGNIWASVTECVESRQRKFIELRARGNFSRREIVAALTANQGNLELAYSELTRTMHKPFSFNIWGPGSGVENLDSARLSPNDAAQGKGLFDRYEDQAEQPRTPYLQHRKQHLGESTNIHRSMLNLNMIGLEDDFRPLNAGGGVSPKLTRRFSFTAGRSNDFPGFSPNFNRMNQKGMSYDASDDMSITSEDMESVDTPFMKPKERQPRESGRGNRSKKSRSTTFLNKLASLRKTRPKPATETQGDIKTEPESDLSESEPRKKPMAKSVSVQQLNRSVKDEKPQRRSFLQRMMRGSSPAAENKESGFIDYTKQDTNGELQARDLEHAAEVSSEEKVHAFLQKMPEEQVPKPEPPKMGFLQRLGLRSKKDSSSAASETGSVAASLGTESDKEVVLSESRATPIEPKAELGLLQTETIASTLKQNEVEVAPEPLLEKQSPKLDIQTARSRFFEDLASTSATNNFKTIDAGHSPKPEKNSNKTETTASQDVKQDSDQSPTNNNLEITETKSNDRAPSPKPSTAKSTSIARAATDSQDSKAQTSSHFKNSELSTSLATANEDKKVTVAKSPKTDKTETEKIKVTEDGKKMSPSPTKATISAEIPKASDKLDVAKAEAKSRTPSPTKATISAATPKVSDKLDVAKAEAKSRTPSPTKAIISAATPKVSDKLEVTKTETKSRTPSPKSSKAQLKKVESKTDSDSAAEERVIRREVKEELIEEREKPKDDKSDTKKVGADGGNKKPEIVQTKLEIVETIVEIVKPRDEKSKFGKNVKEDQKKPAVKKVMADKDSKESKELKGATAAEPPKASKDITYPVSRFAKPREPLFTFKNKSQSIEDNDETPKKIETPKLTKKNAAPLSTEEAEKDVFSNIPTSPTTGLPLKSILKKTPSFNESTPSKHSYDIEEVRSDQPLTLKESSGNRYKQLSLESDEPPEVISSQDKPSKTRDAKETSSKPLSFNDGKEISNNPSTSRFSNKTVTKSFTSNDSNETSTGPSTALEALSKSHTDDKKHDSEPSTPSTTILTKQKPEPSDVASTSSNDAQTLSKETGSTEEEKPVRRRRRPSDAEDISQQAPPTTTTTSSTFPRRRRSVSTERSNAPVYRTRERKMDALVIDTSDVPDIELASLEDDIATMSKYDLPKGDDIVNETKDDSVTDANDSTKLGITSPRVRRQRSISRDRLSRTPSVTDSREGIKGSTTDILRIAKPPAILKQDSFRERRRSTSFDTMKGRFAENNALAKAAKSLETPPESERAVTPVKIGSQVEKYKQKAEEKKIKALTVAKPIDTSAPAMSSKRLVLDNKIKNLLAEGKCETYEQAETAARLMEMNFDEEEAIDASKECGTLYQAISYLSQECELCTGKFPVADMVSMVNCTHRACKGCLKAYFTIQIRDRNIMELICPFCNEPDLTNDDIASDYFNHMDLMLKNLVEPEIHELFHRKLRDRVLMKDPLFRWCSQCSSGFIITNPNQKRLLCPDCKAVTCASCRKRWEKQHEGVTCEKFLEWKEANDPEVQAAGLAQHLAENGIDCPNCHFRYALAKGGCMHFRCIQCQFDFCSGCGKPFKMGLKCGVSEFCSKLGLHAHHPRNCLFYLRDKEPNDLHKLLDEFNVTYNTEPPEGMDVKKVCQVMEQKETSDGLKDDICGKDVNEGYAGLCRIHYVEYLVGLIKKNNLDPINLFDEFELELCLKRATIKLPRKPYGTPVKIYRAQLLEFLVALINKNRVDPVPIMDVHDLQIVLQRGHKTVPEYEIRESEEQYRQRLIEVIKEQLPLEKIEGTF